MAAFWYDMFRHEGRNWLVIGVFSAIVTACIIINKYFSMDKLLLDAVIYGSGIAVGDILSDGYFDWRRILVKIIFFGTLICVADWLKDKRNKDYQRLCLQGPLALQRRQKRDMLIGGLAILLVDCFLYGSIFYCSQDFTAFLLIVALTAIGYCLTVIRARLIFTEGMFCLFVCMMITWLGQIVLDCWFLDEFLGFKIVNNPFMFLGSNVAVSIFLYSLLYFFTRRCASSQAKDSTEPSP